MRNRAMKITKRTHAICVAAPAIPNKPSKPAMSPTTRKVIAQFSICLTSFFRTFALKSFFVILECVLQWPDESTKTHPQLNRPQFEISVLRCQLLLASSIPTDAVSPRHDDQRQILQNDCSPGLLDFRR